MATLHTVATRVLADLSITGHVSLAEQWALARYRELLTRTRFTLARKVGALTIPANLSTGTVSITRNERTVTGDATAQAAWDDVDLIGRHIRLSKVWWKITGQTTTDLKIESPMTEATVTAGTYTIRQRYLALPDDVGQLGAFYSQRLNRPILLRSVEELDMTDPDRSTLIGGPWFLARLGADKEGPHSLEVYPGHEEDETLHYTYWMRPTSDSVDTPLPVELDEGALEEGVLVDAYRWLAERTLADTTLDPTTRVQQSQIYRNDAARQRTVWQSVIDRLARLSNDSTQTTAVVMPVSAKPIALDSITNAEQHVWSTPLT